MLGAVAVAAAVGCAAGGATVGVGTRLASAALGGVAGLAAGGTEDAAVVAAGAFGGLADFAAALAPSMKSAMRCASAMRPSASSLRLAVIASVIALARTCWSLGTLLSIVGISSGGLSVTSERAVIVLEPRGRRAVYPFARMHGGRRAYRDWRYRNLRMSALANHERKCQ